jgi:hypothetical protein
VHVAIDAVKNPPELTRMEVLEIVQSYCGGNPSQKAKPATALGEPNVEVVKVANRLEREPELKAAVINGLTAGHTGEALGQYLADKGFMNSNGGKYTGASNSRFRLAIEHLNSLKNGG